VLCELYREGVLPQFYGAYLSMMFRRHVKLAILHLMRLAPSLYQRTVHLRSLGNTVSGFQLSPERRNYIERIRQMDSRIGARGLIVDTQLTEHRPKHLAVSPTSAITAAPDC